MTKNLSLLGSTGSIGTQSLDVARKRGYRVRALSAFSNVKKIEEQIREFKPDVAALRESVNVPLMTNPIRYSIPLSVWLALSRL